MRTRPGVPCPFQPMKAADEQKKNDVTNTMPLFSVQQRSLNWTECENASNGKLIHKLTYFIKQKIKIYLHLASKLNIKQSN